MEPLTLLTEEWRTTVRQLQELTERHVITWVRQNEADPEESFLLEPLGKIAAFQIYRIGLANYVSVTHEETKYRRAEGVADPVESKIVRRATFLATDRDREFSALLSTVETAVAEDELETLRLVGEEVATFHREFTKKADLEHWDREQQANDTARFEELHQKEGSDEPAEKR